VFFLVSFFHFVLEMIGGFPGFSGRDAGRCRPRKGKADLSGSASFVDTMGKNNACKRKRKTFGPSPQTIRRSERLHRNGKAPAI